MPLFGSSCSGRSHAIDPILEKIEDRRCHLASDRQKLPEIPPSLRVKVSSYRHDHAFRFLSILLTLVILSDKGAQALVDDCPDLEAFVLSSNTVRQLRLENKQKLEYVRLPAVRNYRFMNDNVTCVKANHICNKANDT